MVLIPNKSIHKHTLETNPDSPIECAWISYSSRIDRQYARETEKNVEERCCVIINDLKTNELSKRGYLFLIVDNLTGNRYGNEANKIAIDSLCQYYEMNPLERRDDKDISALIKGYIDDAHKKIIKKNDELLISDSGFKADVENGLYFGSNLAGYFLYSPDSKRDRDQRLFAFSVGNSSLYLITENDSVFKAEEIFKDNKKTTDYLGRKDGYNLATNIIHLNPIKNHYFFIGCGSGVGEKVDEEDLNKLFANCSKRGDLGIERILQMLTNKALIFNSRNNLSLFVAEIL